MRGCVSLNSVDFFEKYIKKGKILRVGLIVLLWLATFSTAHAGDGDTTIVQVFGNNGIHFGDQSVFANDSVTVLANGRVIERTLVLPTFENPVRITAEVEIIPDDNGNTCSADPWDRGGNVTLHLPFHYPIELIKYITGYGGHTTHEEDVSALASVLQGEKSIQVFIDTWTSPAWKVNLKLIYVEDVNYVNPAWVAPVYYEQWLMREDVTNTAPATTLDVPAGLDSFNIAYFTSGHSLVGSGGDEFITKANVIYVNETEVFRQSPWRSNCTSFASVNPCGNYPPSRSGWCPGDGVHPNLVDVSSNISVGEQVIRHSVENIRAEHGYWRVSSYLAGWDSGEQIAPQSISLDPMEGTDIFTNQQVALRVRLRDSNGNWVHNGNATVRLQSDSAGVTFRDSQGIWSNPMDVDVSNGEILVWMQADVSSPEVNVWATDAAGSLTTSDTLSFSVILNYAITASAVADFECNSTSEAAEHAIDGTTATKWCANDALPHWLTITFPDSTPINYIVIKHAGTTTAPSGDPGANDHSGMNTTNFLIQHRVDGAWETLFDVVGNPGTAEGDITEHGLAEAVTIKDLRLYITDPGEDNAARIYEIEVYNLPNPPLSIDDNRWELPIAEQFQLKQNYPNPFNGETIIEMSVPQAGDMVATVVNSLGQIVARLHNGSIASGDYSLRWDGRDGNNVAVASGVYYLNIRYTDNYGRFTSKTIVMNYLK